MIMAGAAAGGIAVGVAAWAVRGRSSNLLAPVRWRGPLGRKRIALTFDDGPSESTPRLLETLSSYGCRATFFMCGMHARRLPSVARTVREAGHEIGNHTETHAAFTFRPAAFMREELERAQRSLQETAGVTPRWYRPAYGVRWPGLGAVLRELHLEMVMWSTIGVDWKWDAVQVTRRLRQGAMPGAIFCLHDGRERLVNPDIGNTIAAVRDIIPALSDAGYQFCPISELFS